ncbi:MAG: ribosomal biogenesis protein [Candidatus Thermoplasmatota archaeon]|jgi:nucleolar protein 56|nr:ribosomal biogenesis protein [Candidatus Thermoplasmatota archaeon]MCL5786231.1 ribosomal biogenesis protein [Candidatus Thermoplasmatota archaeon]
MVLPLGLKYGGDPCQFLREMAQFLSSEKLNEAIREAGDAGKRLCDLRSSLDSHIAESSPGLFPNLYGLLGPLSVELLYHAGGLGRMALMPAGTIQTLGAQRALFRHTSTGGKPPKHGVLFKFPGLSSLPVKKRGKIARIIANKAAIAARADYLGTRIDVNAMVEKIRGEVARAKVQ